MYRQKCQEQIDKSVESTLTYFIISATHLDRRIPRLPAPGSWVMPSRSCPPAPASRPPIRQRRKRSQFQFTLSERLPGDVLTLTIVRFTCSSATAAGHPVGAIFKYYAYQLCFLNSIFKSQRLCLWQTTRRGLHTETSFSPLEV